MPVWTRRAALSAHAPRARCRPNRAAAGPRTGVGSWCADRSISTITPLSPPMARRRTGPSGGARSRGASAPAQSELRRDVPAWALARSRHARPPSWQRPDSPGGCRARLAAGPCPDCLFGLPERFGRRAALGCAALIAVHPLATEAVTYITGRSVALGTMLGFAAACARRRITRESSQPATHLTVNVRSARHKRQGLRRLPLAGAWERKPAQPVSPQIASALTPEAWRHCSC
jgi:hypothetical protein